MSDLIEKGFVVPFSRLRRWTLPPIVPMGGEEAARWPLVRIGDIVTRLHEREQVLPQREYELAGVRWYGAGVFLREKRRGAELSAKYLSRLQPGALVYNRLFAWKEAFAVVREEHGGLFVSNEFPQFVPDKLKVLADFLYLFCIMPETVRSVNAASIGSSAVSRNRLKEEEFLDLQLRLPSLATQHAIVNFWRSHRAEISSIASKAQEIEAAIPEHILESLGLNYDNRAISARAFALPWRQVGRWGIGYIRQSSGHLDPSGGEYPVVRLGEVIADLANGWSPKCLDRVASGEEWGVLKLGAVSFGKFDDRENKALPPSLAPDPALEIKAGEVLISRANIPRLVGACAFVSRTRPRLLLCDKIFRVVPKPGAPIALEYIAEVMKIPHVRRQIESAVTGSSPTMQNITKRSLLALRIPLPPMPIQQQLVAQSKESRNRADAQRERVLILEAELAHALRQMIFGRMRTNL